MDNLIGNMSGPLLSFAMPPPQIKRCRLDKAWEHYKGNDTGTEKLTKKYLEGTTGNKKPFRILKPYFILQSIIHSPYGKGVKGLIVSLRV